ncbi:phosphoglucomutase/phosphomannomutase family protein [Candidatus Margulisiibacteriota bacterium]
MITFGTDGWRAIISDEFTFANVRKVAKAIALYLINHGFSKKPLIIGYDSRFLADKFAEEVAKVVESAGINVLLTERDTPTPVIAWAVKDRKAAGGVVLTASHNPAQYCGIKFIPDYAGPAHSEITAELQENSNKDIDLPAAKKKGEVERFDPRERYIKYIETFVDPAVIRRAKLKVVFDPMYGVGRGYLDKILQNFGCQVEVIHGNRDVLFGGGNPEPAPEYLDELKNKVLELKADIGLANDGDADRFCVVDEKGGFLTANQIIPLLCDYLIAEKGYKGAVVRSVATSHQVDRVALRHKVKVYETPVGFKHIAQLMMKEGIIIGGEESGGLSIKGHIPEKDGILANLLVVDLLARRKKPLSQIWQELIAKVGRLHSLRHNLELPAEEKDRFIKRLQQETPADLAGVKIKKVNKIDGVKLTLAEGSWVLARPSGTEPLVRLYVESDKKEKAAAVLEALKNLI